MIPNEEMNFNNYLESWINDILTNKLLRIIYLKFQEKKKDTKEENLEIPYLPLKFDGYCIITIEEDLPYSFIR